MFCSIQVVFCGKVVPNLGRLLDSPPNRSMEVKIAPTWKSLLADEFQKPYFFRIKSFIAYWLEAVDEHSLHSPFFFDLYTRHIKTRTAAANAAQIETLRKKLLEDNRLITVQDLGSGSTRATVRKVARIARTSLSPPRYSNIYSRLISAFQASNYLVSNQQIIFPLLDPATDGAAQALFTEMFPDFIITGVPAREILLGGGNIHCITQQIPR